MTELETKILSELRKYPPSTAISGTQLAVELGQSIGEILAASRNLEAKSREPGSSFILIISNQRDDRSIEPPDEFYLHQSDATA